MNPSGYVSPLGALLALLFAGTAGTQPAFIDLRDIGPIHGNADAVRDKVTACAGCHGANGVPAVPLFPAIAGLRPEYTYWQLVEFKRDPLPDSPMTALAATLSDQDMRDYAAYYAALPPPPPSGSGSERGRRLYLEGDPATGLPPCQGCHGVDGSGHPLAAEQPRYRVYPALRGQHADYIVRRLADFRSERRRTSSGDRIMHGVAQNVGEAEARDIAAWLQAAPH